MGRQVLDVVKLSAVDVGAVVRAGAGSGPVVRGWNEAAAGAVVRADMGIGLAQGSEPGC